MIKGEYKKIILDVCDVLEFFDHEKERVVEGFKKKFANQILMEIRDCLSDEQRNWIAAVADKKEYDKNDPKIVEIQSTIDSAYPRDKIEKVSREVFKKILVSYVSFMTQRVESDKAEKLNEIINKI